MYIYVPYRTVCVKPLFPQDVIVILWILIQIAFVLLVKYVRIVYVISHFLLAATVIQEIPILTAPAWLVKSARLVFCSLNS
jgi:hypothetical protein